MNRPLRQKEMPEAELQARKAAKRRIASARLTVGQALWIAFCLGLAVYRSWVHVSGELRKRDQIISALDERISGVEKLMKINPDGEVAACG